MPVLAGNDANAVSSFLTYRNSNSMKRLMEAIERSIACAAASNAYPLHDAHPGWCRAVLSGLVTDKDIW